MFARALPPKTLVFPSQGSPIPAAPIKAMHFVRAPSLKSQSYSSREWRPVAWHDRRGRRLSVAAWWRPCRPGCQRELRLSSSARRVMVHLGERPSLCRLEAKSSGRRWQRRAGTGRPMYEIFSKLGCAVSAH